MDRWTVFRRVRIVLFTILIFMCLALAILLLVMLVRDWSVFSTFQRAFLTSLVGVHVFTTILLYLMVVVIFRLWLDVARAVALVMVHVASSVIFFLYAMRTSCGKSGTGIACNAMNFVFFIGSSAISGLLMIYLVYVVVMACLPRPVESLTGKAELGLPPTPKIEGLGHRDSRRWSQSSATSETALLEGGSLSDDRASFSGLPRYGAFRVVNGDADHVPATPTPASWQQEADHRGVSPSFSTRRSPSSFSQASIHAGTRTQVGHFGETPRTSPFPNYFHDPVLRYDTPGSVTSMSSTASTTPTVIGEPELETKAFSDYYMGNTMGYISPPEKAFDCLTSWDYIGQPPQYIPHILSPGYLPPSLTPRQTSVQHARSYTVTSGGTDPYYMYRSSPLGHSNAYLNVPRTPHVTMPRSLTPGGQSIHSVTPTLDFYPTSLHTPTPSRPSPALGGYRQRPVSGSMVFRSMNPFASNGPTSNETPSALLTTGRTGGIRRHATVPNGYVESAPRFKNGIPVEPQTMTMHAIDQQRGSQGQSTDGGQWRRLVMNAANGNV